MVHAVDRQALNDGLYEGESVNPDTLLNPKGPLHARAIEQITRYPLDLRRTEQLLNEAGFNKDGDGFFVHASGERLRPDFRVLAGTQFERGGAILTEAWRRAGIDVQPEVLPAVQIRQNEVRNTFPGIATPGSMGGRDASALEFFTSGQIGTAARGWAGQNRGGWSNPEVDRHWDAYNITLDPDQRAQHAVRIMKLLSDELPAWPLYWDFNTMSHQVTVRGPNLGIVNTSTPFWNAHEWELL
jgi:peptide/nickel transport system substrate-binding protein